MKKRSASVKITVKVGDAVEYTLRSLLALMKVLCPSRQRLPWSPTDAREVAYLNTNDGCPITAVEFELTKKPIDTKSGHLEAGVV